MFRELNRKKQQLSEADCIKLLCEQTRGVLSVQGEDGYPYGMPMNHWYEDGKLYFHCGKVGHRVDALRKDDRVSFCVYDDGVREEGGWAYRVNSVIVFGQMRMIEDEAKIVAITRKLCYKFTTDEAYIEKELSESAKNTLLLELNIEHLCGKSVLEA